MLRLHGMVREVNGTPTFTASGQAEKPGFGVHPDFIFAFRPTTCAKPSSDAIIGRSQLKSLDQTSSCARATCSASRGIDAKALTKTEFMRAGTATTLQHDPERGRPAFVDRLMRQCERRASSSPRQCAADNQVRQPYLRGIVTADHHPAVPALRARAL